MLTSMTPTARTATAHAIAPPTALGFFTFNLVHHTGEILIRRVCSSPVPTASEYATASPVTVRFFTRRHVDMTHANRRDSTPPRPVLLPAAHPEADTSLQHVTHAALPEYRWRRSLPAGSGNRPEAACSRSAQSGIHFPSIRPRFIRSELRMTVACSTGALLIPAHSK